MYNNYFISEENYERAKASPPICLPDRKKENSTLSIREEKSD